MASRRISSLVTTLLPRRLITPFSPLPSAFHRSNKIHTLSKFSPSSPTHLVFQPRPFSTAPLSDDVTDIPMSKYINSELSNVEKCPDLKQAKEKLIKKLREEGVPFQVVDNSEDDNEILLRREYGGEMINIVVKLHEDTDEYEYYQDAKYFDVNVVKKDGATLKFVCKLNDLEKFRNENKEEFEIVRVSVFKDGELDDQDDGKNTQYFRDMDKDLQNGFLDYLDKRGIKTDLVAWLRDYKKDDVEYKMWLKNMKKFVE